MPLSIWKTTLHWEFFGHKDLLTTSDNVFSLKIFEEDFPRYTMR